MCTNCMCSVCREQVKGKRIQLGERSPPYILALVLNFVEGARHNSRVWPCFGFEFCRRSKALFYGEAAKSGAGNLDGLAYVSSMDVVTNLPIQQYGSFRSNATAHTLAHMIRQKSDSWRRDCRDRASQKYVAAAYCIISTL
jgi:hypothetical protein